MTDTPPRESWEGLRRGTVRPVVGSEGDDEMVMRATSGGDGRLLLEWLRKTYIEHECSPGASEAELREAEAKRRLVHGLENMRDRAIERAGQRSKA